MSIESAGTDQPSLNIARRYPIGAEIVGDAVSFRVWAPSQQRVAVLLGDGSEHCMTPEDGGYFRVDVPTLGAGALYRFRLGSIPDTFADPASRSQPEGPAGYSAVVDPHSYQWRDHDWQGVTPAGQVLYEMHIGTFTPEGTYAAAAEKLHLLKEIGITCLKVMPLNEFCGEFGWGYDGVLPFAPTRLYGGPDDLRSFIDTAHQLGIGVILDVVYNHFGVGDRFRDFAPDYFTDKYWNEWGSSINFDGDNCGGVREFFAKNAAYWIDEYHFDGLRLDATQALNDSSDEHIMALINREARAAAGDRTIYLVAENEPQDTRLVRGSGKNGYGLDALWNDDFHHSAMVALTGRNEAYYHDHLGRAQEFISSAKYGYLFQGQRYDWQDAPRGQPGFDLAPSNFVHFLQNHDQVANSGTGMRMNTLASPARVRALTALLLLGPQTPMLFQGQEFGASSPFYYFADHSGDLLEIVRNGRIDSLKQFPSLKDPAFAQRMPVPAERSTFEHSKLDWAERDANRHIIALHRDLLALRQQSRAISGYSGAAPQISQGQGLDGSVIAQRAFLLRFFADAPEEERLLIVNLGEDVVVTSLAEPLLAPPARCEWSLAWSSEDFFYGGGGKRPVDLQRRWTLSADSAILLAPKPAARRPIPDRDDLFRWQDVISNIGG
ncbi:malto-oligosyltrehalose trehalohydrolase [Rhizobium sp. S163]|uniref:malto-oligosyltrehalose trehalohydrolase n=1 Tax=Rhizobium sp. S163 TaxID=3055039 RepID=UPI0025A9E35B|nr:malto-oligosyltrehalose trehalohydrolase [Rhizobium sp. S163]MDM9644858.1 malto-oligosyltrehalose trehalohydrolase [Rhizobium sp. S163]